MDGGKECKVEGASLDKPLAIPELLEELSLEDQMAALHEQMRVTTEQLRKMNRVLSMLADLVKVVQQS